MKAFNSNFTTTSFSDWLQKAEKDLKGKSLDELSWSWNDTIKFPPLYFDSPSELIVPVSNKSWSICESFTVDSPTQSNNGILDGLSRGLESLHLMVSSPLSKADWAKLLDKVILTYITLYISCEEDSSLAALDSYLQDNEWTPDQLFVVVSDGTPIPERLKECQNVATQFNLNTKSLALDLAKQLQAAEQLLMGTTIKKNIIFNTLLSKNFYQNVASIQTLKILWQNILDAHQLDPNTRLQMVAHIQDHAGLDENTQKINATIQAISADVSGIDSLLIHPQSTAEDQGFERRINRNIQHLLKLESFLDQVMNPTEGSYYFDHLTKTLAEETWEIFKG